MTSMYSAANGEVAPPWLVHIGALMAGWGIFNLIDSANHFIVGLHHIRDDLGGPVGWDIGFLVLALVQIAAGMAAVRSGRSDRGVASRAAAA
jgi:uncharacterized membrane protein